jgi:amino acid transporter, AAT family
MASTSEDSLLSAPTTTYGTMKTADTDNDLTGEIPVGSLPAPPIDRKTKSGLHRGLSARQVQMIAIAGTIGTGLFLGTGRSLAKGGPASMLICYSIIGFIVYVTLLLLGEMATQYPVAGES